MHRKMYKQGSLLAMLAVMFGAFGAHILKDMLEPETLAGFQTATQYQMVHAIALIITGLKYRHYKSNKLVWASYAFLSGIVCFSGSIYLRVILGLMGIEGNLMLALVTPVGGMLFMLGWLMLFLSIPSSVQEQQKSE